MTFEIARETRTPTTEAVGAPFGPRGGRGRATAVSDEDAARLADRLRRHGLRPTRQRIDLLAVLLAEGDRHVSAELVYDEASARGASVSLATVYNTLKQFTGAGLLAELAVSGAKSFFDTRVDPHHHFYVEEAGEMIDVAAEAVEISKLPDPPPGMEIVGFDVVMRLRRAAK